MNEEQKPFEERVCEHCKGLLCIRMPVPSSTCDHLHYPESCETCTIASQRKLPKKKQTRQAKKIREIDTRVSYSGERSPYWDFLAANSLAEDGALQELPEGNPDVLSDEQSLYHQPLTEEADFRADIIKETMPELSPQQQKIIQLCGVEGRTMREAAERLNMKLATVQTLLNRARAKIIRRYEQRRQVDR